VALAHFHSWYYVRAAIMLSDLFLRVTESDVDVYRLRLPTLLSTQTCQQCRCLR